MRVCLLACLLTYLLTYSMVQDIIWKADCYSAHQKVSRFLTEPKGSFIYGVDQGLVVVVVVVVVIFTTTTTTIIINSPLQTKLTDGHWRYQAPYSKYGLFLNVLIYHNCIWAKLNYSYWKYKPLYCTVWIFVHFTKLFQLQWVSALEVKIICGSWIWKYTERRAWFDDDDKRESPLILCGEYKHWMSIGIFGFRIFSSR